MSFERKDHVDSPLYVCTVIFNPVRYRSRWKHHEDFERMVAAQGNSAVLYTAEVAFGNRDFVVTQPDNPRHLQVRTKGEIWYKENIQNRLVQQLPHNWRYVAMVDDDISFSRSDWANETIHKLQHNKIVQMWSEAEDLSPDYECIQKHHSFMYSYKNHIKIEKCDAYYGNKPSSTGFIEYHPGWAWAYRNKAWDDLGGMIDWGILGAGDNHQAKALIGDAANSIHPGLHGNYRKMVMQWQDRAMRYIQTDVGYVPGQIKHYWHGKKKLRQYWNRWKILLECQFDPFTDLKRDWQGIYQLVVENKRQEKLRDLLRHYFAQRNEDGIDLE